MKKILIIGVLALGAVLMSLQSNNTIETINETESGINFQKGSWKEVLALAKKENKIVFVDIYAVWCGPCKMLKKNTFSDESVGKLYNKKFVNVAIDAEVGEGIAIAKKYNVKAYPTLLFVNPDGSIVKSTMGYHNPEDFINLGQSVSQ